MTTTPPLYWNTDEALDEFTAVYRAAQNAARESSAAQARYREAAKAVVPAMAKARRAGVTDEQIQAIVDSTWPFTEEEGHDPDRP